MYAFTLLFLVTLNLFHMDHARSAYLPLLPITALHVPDRNNRASGYFLAIGHENGYGGGPLNKFGQDFQKHRAWATLCPLDSDGDGLTNGQELGDPDCLWRPGDASTVLSKDGITHPGVCDVGSCSATSKPPTDATPMGIDRKIPVLLIVGTVFNAVMWIVKLGTNIVRSLQ